MTEKLYEELDEAKAEIEKLRSECHVKTDLCDNLKRSNNDQLKRIQELNLKLEKQAQEIEANADEVYAAKQSLEDLACKFKEKEDIIKSSTSAIDKLRADFDSKLRESEEEKRKLVSSLEEAYANISDLEHKNRAFMDKIEVLKEGIVSVSQKKCATESKMANASKQMRETGDMYEKLEEEKSKLEEQLKWKNEQFKYLEEAHEKLKKNLHTKEKEWDTEKCTFFDEISALQTKLDSHIKLLEVHKRRLQMCNQALSHEENQRKGLDIQLSELNSRFLETNSKLERLTDEKERVCKEMECKIEILEEENRELVFSLKELKESQAIEASTIVKLQNELKALDHIHTVSEAEWRSRSENLVVELNSCKLELESKETCLKEKEFVCKEMQCKIDNLEEENGELVFSLKELKESQIREAELSSRIEKLGAELNFCRLELESKEACLKEKECVCKEMECKIENLEEENRELVFSLKELKESQIREAELSSRLEKMGAKLNSCRFELESKEACLKEKICVCKEMECKIESLEEENRELVVSLKELKESRIREAELSSRLEKMGAELNSCRLELESKEACLKEKICVCKEMECKIESLEEENRELVVSLKELKESQIREAELSSRCERMVAELNSCRLELESKEGCLKEKECVCKEMECKIETLEEENQELIVSVKELKKSQIGEAEWSSRFEKMVAELNSCRLELESKESCLKEKECVCKEMECKIENLEEENRELVFSLKELKESQIREAEWSSRIEKMGAELHSCRLGLESKETRLKEITTELDNHTSLILQLTMEKVALKSTLLEARSKIDEEKFLLQQEIESREEQLVQTKTEIMNLSGLLDKANKEMAECYGDINEVEFELQTCQSVAEKLKVNLEADQEMRKQLEASLLAQVAIEVNLKEDLQEKERIIKDLEEKIKEQKHDTHLRMAKDIEMWEQEWVTKELEAAILAQLETERIHEDEKQSLNKLVEEKDQRINNLQQIMCSLEEEFDHSTASFSSQLAKMQGEMNVFHEAWEKIITTVVLKEIEVQEKDLMIIEFKKDLEEQVEFVKKCMFSVKKLSSENEKLMDIIGGASEWIQKLSREDGQVMGCLRSIMMSFDENRAVGKGSLELEENHFDPVKENKNVYHQSSPKRRNINMVVENSVDERSPLRTLNG